jgi:hypothetical protein
MKIKLTAKFSLKRQGDVIEVSELTATQLIKEGKATAAGAKAAKSKEKKQEESKEEPVTNATENIVIE